MGLLCQRCSYPRLRGNLCEMCDDLMAGVPPWQHDDDELVAETSIFALRRLRASSAVRADANGQFVYLDCPDWVNVIALTADREVVLIAQFRHGVAAVTLEIPGGMVDPGEDPLAAGLRELREETGYGGGRARLIGVVSPNPAIMNNRCHTVLVENVEQVAEATPEEHEEIAVRRLPLTRVAELIRGGAIHHALVVAAFHHLDLLEAACGPQG